MIVVTLCVCAMCSVYNSIVKVEMDIIIMLLLGQFSMILYVTVAIRDMGKKLWLQYRLKLEGTSTTH